jgi:hypothetical protein
MVLEVAPRVVNGQGVSVAAGQQITVNVRRLTHPATCFMASSALISRPPLPITTPSSTSWCTEMPRGSSTSLAVV